MKSMFAPLLFCLVSGCAMAQPAGSPSTAAQPSVTVHGHIFSVEFATDDASRERGLMLRTTLPADHGMLFVFPYTGPQAFWMKNTLIPLDMLFFGENRKLVSMQLDVPPCKADPCPTYPSNAPARYVLELPAGTAVRIGAEIGDMLEVNGNPGAVR